MKKCLMVIVYLLVFPVICFGGYTDNGDGTVTDNETGLIWMKATADTDLDGDVDSNDMVSCQQAREYCENLTLSGYTDWRLPNIKELQSIVDLDKAYPAVDVDYFPNTLSAAYWSSTNFANNSGHAWLISFDTGGVGNYFKSTTCYVRAVRGGQ